MSDEGGNHRLFYVVGALLTVLLGLAGYIWTGTQAEINSQRLVDAEMSHRIDLMQGEFDRKLHALELQRQLSLRAEVTRLERWLAKHDLALERIRRGLVPPEENGQ